VKRMRSTQRVPDCGLRNGPAALFTVALALALLAAPVPSPGQQPAKVYRIGFLNISAAGYDTDPHHCFLPGEDTPNWQAWVEVEHYSREDGVCAVKGLSAEPIAARAEIGSSSLRA
jgi:hypothetical protein